MNNPVVSQVEIALQSLRLDVQNLKGSEFQGDTYSRVISKSQEAISLAQSLPPEQRAAVAAQALQAQQDAVAAVSAAQLDVSKEEKIKKELEAMYRLSQENPLSVNEVIKQQEEKLVEKQAYTKETLVETLRSKLTEKEVEEFNVLSKVLEIPGIAEEFLPFEKKAALVNEVFEPEKAVEFLRRDIETTAVHQILTNYVEFGADMPDLTKSMLDNFRDVEANKTQIEDCDALQKAWEAKRNTLGADQEEKIGEVKRAIQEAINKKYHSTNAIHREGLNTQFSTIVQLGRAAEGARAEDNGIDTRSITSIFQILNAGKKVRWADEVLENNRQRQIDTASVAKRAIEDILNGGANQQSKIEQEADKKSKTSPDRGI